MANFFIHIVLGILLFNICAGAVSLVIPYFAQNPSTMGGMTYREGDAAGFVNTMSSDVEPGSLIQDKGNQIYRVFDLLNIGFIAKFLTAIKTLFYGIITIFDNIFGGLLDTGVRSGLFAVPGGIFYWVLNIGYVYTAWTMWTGKYIGD